MSADPSKSVDCYRWINAIISPLDAPFSQLNLDKKKCPDLYEVIHVASKNLVLPNLYLGLQSRGMLNQLPEDFSETLEAYKNLNTLRNASLRRQIIEISSALNAIGISPIWLKGANNLLSPDWQNSGRMMLDLDFWQPDPRDLLAAEKCLDQLGYKVPEEYLNKPNEGDQHLAPRFRDGELARIELHRNIVNPKVAELLPDAEALNRVEWFEVEGVHIGRLSLPDRIMHSFVQCTEMSGDSMIYAQVSLMKVLDFVQLSHSAGQAYPSIEFLKRIDNKRWQSRSRPFLSYVEHDFGLLSGLEFNRSYISRKRFSIIFPRLNKIELFFRLIFHFIVQGRLGPMSSWKRRLENYWS